MAIAGKWLIQSLLIWSTVLACGAGALPRVGAYESAVEQLGAVHYLKPAESAVGLLASMAPLLFLENRSETDCSGYLDRPGTLISANPRQIDFTQASVYAATTNLLADGRLLPQVSYYWFYPPNGKRGKSLNRLVWQGVRITLNKAGEPVIWEVLNHTADQQIVFVARSLEEQAARKYGKPETGRRFAIETAVASAPNATVARVIQDGPVPMGPAVYLRKETRDIASIVCRCMPPQAARVVSTLTYDLPNDPTVVLPSGLSNPLPLSQVLRVLPE